jgi:dCMP deaminase
MEKNMATTINEIREWLGRYDKSEYSHVLIVCDSFDYEDYPVAVKIGEDIASKIAEYTNKNMQRIMEVYNLSMDIEEQIKSKKVWNDQDYVAPIKENKVVQDERRERSSWALTWMSIALQYANHRSMDPATRHGCIFVNDDNKLISMGYNSFPRDCMDDKLPLTRPEKYEVIVHSETNAIINSERSLDGTTAYITGFPCPRCFSNMLNAKIKKIIYGPIGSHQLRESDMKLIAELNISKETLYNKIEIVNFADIEDLDKLCLSYEDTRDYVQSKMEQTNLING